jgi:hypothetical protein
MRYPGDEDGIGADEQQLADLLKRVVPEPPRQLTYEEITVRNVERTVKSWLVPTLAAASILVIGGAVGAVAATRSGQAASGTSVAYQGSGHPGPATPTPWPTPPGCQPVAEPSAEPTPPAQPTPSAEPTSAASVRAPAVVGQRQVVAERAIQQAGLKAIVQETASRTVPAGTVLSESPASGTRVPVGATVTLTVAGSAGAPATPTPTPTATCPAPTPVPTTGEPAAPTAEPSAVPPATPSAKATPVPAAPTAEPSAVPTAG